AGLVMCPRCFLGRTRPRRPRDALRRNVLNPALPSGIRLYQAGGGGFEPSIRLTTDNGFRDRRIPPASHPSGGRPGGPPPRRRDSKPTPVRSHGTPWCGGAGGSRVVSWRTGKGPAPSPTPPTTSAQL